MQVNTSALDKDAESYYLNEDKGAKFVKEKFIEFAHEEYGTKWILELLNKNSNVLALGYGDGVQLKKISPACHRLTIIEGSKLLTDRAAEDLKGATCVHTLFEDFKPTEKFDLIIATHVLEHLDNPVDLLVKMKQWLSKDGKILIAVPNKESIHRKLAVIMKLQPQLDTLGPRDIAVGHQRVYSLDTLEKDVLAAGYKIELKFGYTLKCLPNSMMLEYSNELIQALNEISTDIPPHLLANIGMIVKP
ncbi:MAG: class I SAM-dependent methyltransferase [Bacteroidia bacterium]|nr:class I SAM-dependent methyltransferase [Bacteroidia bacterium]